MNAARPRVLICEDSRTYASALTRLLEHGHMFEVVGVSSSAEEALASMPQLRPDLLTMDLELPGMRGIEAIEQIMSVQPVPILVLSSHVGAHTQNAAAALAVGALDALAKSDVDLLDPAGPAADAFRRRLTVLSRARVIRHPKARLKPPRRREGRSSDTPRAIGVCASMGGPKALATMLASVPLSFPIPIFVVQHIASGFTEGLARWLDAAVPLPVAVAVDGRPADRGVWLAPEGSHLVVERSGRVILDRESVDGRYRPSGDLLLRSLAASMGSRAVSVVLTGMGSDGAEGSLAVREAGGLTIAQDECTAVAYGMPRAAAERGVDLVLPLDRIGPELGALVRQGRLG